MTKQQDVHRPILLLGAYGRGNAGDDVFLYCALTLFKGRTVYINSADDTLLPAHLKGKVRTISTVSPRDLFKKIALYIKIREVIYWGGDLWVELYGTRTPRQLLYKMVLLNLLLRLTGKKIYYVGCGIGDLHGFSLWLARCSGRMAKKIIAREQRSAKVLGLPNVAVLPDLAVNLPYNKAVLHTFPAKRPFSITISVLQSIPDSKHTFPRLIKHIAGLVDMLPEKDFTVTLLAMHATQAEPFDDVWASEQLQKLIPNRSTELFVSRDLAATVEKLRTSDLVIGTRLHAAILATLNATPSIGIAYRPKVRSFFEDNGLGEYCIGLDNLEQLPEVFHKVYDDYTAVAEQYYKVSRANLSKRTAYRTLAEDI